MTVSKFVNLNRNITTYEVERDTTHDSVDIIGETEDGVYREVFRCRSAECLRGLAFAMSRAADMLDELNG